MKKLDSFPGCIQHRRFGELDPVGEMDKLVLIETVEALGAADCQRGLAIGNVGDRRYEIIGGGQTCGAFVRVVHRPVLDVHVGIANKRVEHESPDKLPDIGVIAFGREGGNASVLLRRA